MTVVNLAVPPALLKTRAPDIVASDRVRNMAMSVTAYPGGSTTVTSPIVLMTNTAGLVAGQPFYGPNIPYNATVLTVDSPTQIHINQNASATGAGPFTFLAVAVPTMAAAPAFAQQGTQWFPAGQVVPPNSGILKLTGGLMATQFGAGSDQYVAGPIQNGGGRFAQGSSTFCAFDFDGDQFEFGMGSAVAQGSPGFRLWVNEQAHSMVANTPGNFAAATYTKVTFATRAYRRIVIDITELTSSAFPPQQFLVACPLTCSIVPATITTSRLAVCGDSIALASIPIVADPGLGYSPDLARRLGLADVFLTAASGTGPATSNGGGGTNIPDYTNRTADVIAANPAVVLWQGSVNDGLAYPGNAALITSELTKQLTALKGGLPTSIIAMTSPLRVGNATANDIAVGALYKQVCSTLNIPYVDALGQSGGQAWFVGTGTNQAPNGTGNADFYAYNDGVHPIQPGSVYLAQQLANALAPLLSFST